MNSYVLWNYLLICNTMFRYLRIKRKLYSNSLSFPWLLYYCPIVREINLQKDIQGQRKAWRIPSPKNLIPLPWPWKSIGFPILLRTKYVPSLVKIHWGMLILECSQGCYGRTDGSVTLSLRNFGEGINTCKFRIRFGMCKKFRKIFNHHLG